MSVKGNTSSAIPSLTQFGLSEGPIRVIPEFRHRDITLDAWGGEVAAETQFMLAAVTVSMNLIHFDRSVLDTVLLESMGGAPAIGQLARAGSRLGNNLPRFGAAGGLANHFMGLNIASPIANKTWRFFFSYLTQTPMEFPLGTEKSVVQLNWRVIPYTQDPWNNGLGAQGALLFDYGQDS